MSIKIQPPFELFTDIDGKPLEHGYIYIGEPNMDPQANPITVYWDEARTIVATQPIRTLSGYPVRNGSPANVYAASAFSVRITNINGTLVFSVASTTGGIFMNPTTNVDNIAALRALGSGFTVAQPLGYYTPGDGGGGPVRVKLTAPVGGLTDNGGSIIKPGGAVGDAIAEGVSYWGWEWSGAVNVKWFGAKGDGSADDYAAIAAANTYCTANSAELLFPPGTHRHTQAITFTCNVRGEGMPVIESVGDIKSVIVNRTYGYFKGIKIAPDGTGGASNDALTLAGAARTLFENVVVEGAGNDGIVFDSTSATNNIAAFNNVSSRLNGRDGMRIATGLNNNACLLSSIDVSFNTGNGLTLTGFIAGTVLNNVVAQNNTGYGIAGLGALVRNNVGTVYVEANTAGDIYFDSDAHTNMLWVSNDGSSIVDDNGTNTIISAGSGPTQRYTFNTMDFETARIYNRVNTGALAFTQTGDQLFAITASNSSAYFFTTFAKGAASGHGVTVEGELGASSLILSLDTLVDGSTNLPAGGKTQVLTANTTPTTIATITGGVPGKEITIIFGDNNTTIAQTGAVKLAGGVDFVGTTRDVLTLIYGGSSDWYEKSRSVNP